MDLLYWSNWWYCRRRNQWLTKSPTWPYRWGSSSGGTVPGRPLGCLGSTLRLLTRKGGSSPRALVTCWRRESWRKRWGWHPESDNTALRQRQHSATATQRYGNSNVSLHLLSEPTPPPPVQSSTIINVMDPSSLHNSLHEIPLSFFFFFFLFTRSFHHLLLKKTKWSRMRRLKIFKHDAT